MPRNGVLVPQSPHPHGQDGPRFIGCYLQLLLPFLVLTDAGQDVIDLQVRGLHRLPQPVEPAPYFVQLFVNGLHLLPLLLDHAVQLFVDQLHQVPDVALGQDVFPYLLNDHPLEPLGVEPGSVAGPLSLLQERMADVVGELAALGLMGGERLATGLAPDYSAEQVGTGSAAGVNPGGSLGFQNGGHPLEVVPGDDGREGVLHPNWRDVVLGPGSPDQCSGIAFVGEDPVNGGFGPAVSLGAGDTLLVQGFGDVQDAGPEQGHLEDAAHHAVGGRVQLQLGAFLGSVLDRHLPVAVGGVGANPEATGGRLPHPPQNFLGQIFAIELVHTLDDGLHKLAGGRVVGVLGDGSDPDSPLAEHGLEGHGVLPLAGEAREFPDQDFLER